MVFRLEGNHKVKESHYAEYIFVEDLMSVENGVWIMKGVDWNHPECIHTVEELEEYIEAVGFLPLFANEVEGRKTSSGRLV